VRIATIPIFILEVRADENIAPHTFEYRGAINITIVIRGDNTNRTIRLRSNGTMFTVRPNVTLILDNNITLHGHNGNNNTLINVNGGALIMNHGSTIAGNTRGTGGGGGIDVPSGTFTMNGGTISGNKTVDNGGGGVCICGGTFTMIGGIITGNHAACANERGGGGVLVHSGTFNMRGGTVSGNTACGLGGGVYRTARGTMNLTGGIITGNSAKEYGGGVYIQVGYSGGTFTKTGGTITGYNSDRNNGNVVRDDEGILSRRGHAVYADENRRKETTAGARDNLNTSQNGAVGGWDN